MQVFDYDMASDDDVMGGVTLSLADPALLPAEPARFPVLPCTGCVVSSGELELSATFTRTPTPRVEEFWGGLLSIKIVEGMDLIALDKGLFGSGLSDPFIKIQGTKKPKAGGLFGGGRRGVLQKGKVETFAQTKVCKKTLNPMWNERLKAVFKPEHQQNCTLAIFDHDLMSGSDPMGVVNINLNQYKDTGEDTKVWLDVMGCKGCKDATGKIHVHFTWAPELSPEEKAR